MKIIQAYQCEFCPKSSAYVSKTACQAHETRCFDNPATRSCATCEHLTRYNTPVPGRPGFVTPAFECRAKKPSEPLTTGCRGWKHRVNQ